MIGHQQTTNWFVSAGRSGHRLDGKEHDLALGKFHGRKVVSRRVFLCLKHRHFDAQEFFRILPEIANQQS